MPISVNCTESNSSIMFQILVKIVIANKFSFIVDVHYKDALSKASKEVEKLMTEKIPRIRKILF